MCLTLAFCVGRLLDQRVEKGTKLTVHLLEDLAFPSQLCGWVLNKEG